MMELRIILWSFILVLLLGEVRAQEPKDVLKEYQPLGEVMLCRDVGLPCIPMLRKDTDTFFAVFSAEGKLIAITKVKNGSEEVIWGELELPLKKGEIRL